MSGFPCTIPIGSSGGCGLADAMPGVKSSSFEVRRRKGARRGCKEFSSIHCTLCTLMLGGRLGPPPIPPLASEVGNSQGLTGRDLLFCHPNCPFLPACSCCRASQMSFEQTSPCTCTRRSCSCRCSRQRAVAACGHCLWP